MLKQGDCLYDEMMLSFSSVSLLLHSNYFKEELNDFFFFFFSVWSDLFQFARKILISEVVFSNVPSFIQLI